MTIHVRAPATTANLGPGFDVAGAALDLWNELELGGPDGTVDESHLGVRAFTRYASPANWSFTFTDRIPRERGLGSSAAVVALGLVAGAIAAGEDPSADELLAQGIDLEGHADNLAAALAGGVCLTWEGRIARIADDVPAAAIAVVPADAREHGGGSCGAAAGRCRTPTPSSARVARRCSAPRSRAAMRGCSRPAPTIVCTSRTAPARAAPRRDPREPAGRRTRRDALRLGADRDRVGARRHARATSSRSSPTAIRSTRSCTSRSRRPEQDPHERSLFAQDRSGEAAQRRADRRRRSRAGARDAEGHRLRRRGARAAARRHRDDVDRDDAVQLESARARAPRSPRHPRSGRHAGRVQHDRGLRRRLDGNRRDARVTRLARDDRGLDRARRARPSARRPRVPRRLRQDDPRRSDGARAARPAGARALQRLDRAGSLPRPRRDDPGRLRGGRRRRRRNDEQRRRARARGRRLPGGRRVRRAVHREHDGDRGRVPRHQPRRPERRAGDRPGEARGRVRGRPDRDAARPRRHAALAGDHARRDRECDCRDRGDRRLDERRAAPARDRVRARHRPDDRRVRPRSPRARRSSPTSSRAAASSRPICMPQAASRSSRASC